MLGSDMAGTLRRACHACSAVNNTRTSREHGCEDWRSVRTRVISRRSTRGPRTPPEFSLSSRCEASGQCWRRNVQLLLCVVRGSAAPAPAPSPEPAPTPASADTLDADQSDDIIHSGTAPGE